MLDQAAPAIDRTLSRNLSLGWSWLNEVKRGASMEEIASRNGISQRAIARLIDLAFLAPDIVDAIIAGRQPVNLTANALIRHCPDDLQVCGDHTPVPPSREQSFLRSQPMA